MNALVASLGHRGRYIQIGVPGKKSETANVQIPVNTLVGKRALIEGSAMGGATAANFVPTMIRWYREGLFPLDKIVRFYSADQISEACEDMLNGSTVKPVLTW